MRKVVCFIAILGIIMVGPVSAATPKEDCPDCPKNPTPSTLDPGWKQFVAPPPAPGELPDCHRVQFQKQSCIDCHKKEDPVRYQQWLGSKHGINNVACGVCHGDVNNYRARPDKVVCIGCHSLQVNNMPPNALVTNCSFCHHAHWFTVHKIKDYERFAPGREKRFNVPGF